MLAAGFAHPAVPAEALCEGLELVEGGNPGIIYKFIFLRWNQSS